MNLRAYSAEKDFSIIKDWITDERTHAMWCANKTSFPIQKESFEGMMADLADKFGDSPFVAVDEKGEPTGFFCYSLNNDTKEGMLKFVMVDPERRTETGAFSYHDEVWDRCNMVLKNPREISAQNPWDSISLDDYEKHMSLDSVQQLQKMNSIMKDQFEAYPVKTAMVLGIAGGNGLEYVKADKYRTVYGVDINEEYLSAVSKRYEYLGDVLQCVRADLTDASVVLPKAELLIANLLIEYIGYSAFMNMIRQTEPEYVSCVIQINTNEENWVSESPYIHAFDGLEAVHCQMEEKTLSETMASLGYNKILRESVPLPNGKALLRVDYK